MSFYLVQMKMSSHISTTLMITSHYNKWLMISNHKKGGRFIFKKCLIEFISRILDFMTKKLKLSTQVWKKKL